MAGSERAQALCTKHCGRKAKPHSQHAPQPLAALAQRVGNHGMQRLLLQAKLAIGSTDDPLEREADRAAEQALAVAPTTQPETGSPPLVQRAAALAATANEGTAPPSVEHVLGAGGQPLGTALRSDMEQRFGHDFSQVRLHLGAAAAQSACDVNAQAYTVGQHIVFGAGHFQPGTPSGRQLIAHELAHVVQQGGANTLRRRYRLSEMQTAVSGGGSTGNVVGSTPRALFFSGSSANTSDRKAMVIAGIHGTERSAIALGAAIEGELSGGSLAPDFHTLFVPRANPGRRRGTANVSDLNREYGGSVPSAEPIATEIETMVLEFEPERLMSIHAVDNAGLGGLFLDPIRASGTAPGAVNIRPRRAAAFTHDARNRDAMTLTEDLIGAVRGSGVTGASAATLGNTPGSLPVSGGPADFAASRYPPPAGSSTSPGASRFNLLYPQQSQVRSGAHGETSLGAWASQLPFAPAVITLEVPGYAERRGGRNWRPFLPAIRQFLRLPVPAPTPSPSPSTPTQAPAPTSTSTSSGTLRRVPLTEADLTSQRGVPLAFMREVYRRQVAIWTARGVAYTHEIPSRDRVSLASGDVITGRSVSVHRDIANAVRNLLRDARTALAAAGSVGVTGLAVRSGYRSAPDQFSIWQREFPRYYRDTRTARAALPGGAHGADAAQFLAEYVNQRVFSPGYSPHQQGRTIDFSYQSATDWPSATDNWAEADSSASGITTWTASWFFGWLSSNAARYGFAQNPAINEPWHWEWHPPRASLWRRFVRLLLRWWRWILYFFFGGEAPSDEKEGSATTNDSTEGPTTPPADDY